MTKIINLKQKNNRFEPVWNLDFEIYLEFGAWDLLFMTNSIRHQTPMQIWRTLT